MTNAEKFKEVFGFEVNKPTVNYGMYCPHGRKDMNDRAVECVACNRDCISDFWQSEYKESKEIHLIPIGDKLSDTKTITISKSAVKHGNKDYVVYKRDWLMEHLDSEFEVLKGARKLKEAMK